MEYLSISQTAEKWGIKQRRIRALCGEGRIPGACKAGAYWLIPENAEKPNRDICKEKRRLVKMQRGYCLWKCNLKI